MTNATNATLKTAPGCTPDDLDECWGLLRPSPALVEVLADIEVVSVPVIQRILCGAFIRPLVETVGLFAGQHHWARLGLVRSSSYQFEWVRTWGEMCVPGHKPRDNVWNPSASTLRRCGLARSRRPLTLDPAVAREAESSLTLLLAVARPGTRSGGPAVALATPDGRHSEWVWLPHPETVGWMALVVHDSPMTPSPGVELWERRRTPPAPPSP